jgi:hypothetical protein
MNILSFDWAFWFQWIMATTLGWVLGRFIFPNLAIVTIGLGLGILQWFVLQRRIRNARLWILSTTLGWVFGTLLILTFIPEGMDFVAGAAVGISTGASQWLVLRREVRWSGWWIVINVVAWTTGMALLPGVLLTAVIAGCITGFALELLLRSPILLPDRTMRGF